MGYGYLPTLNTKAYKYSHQLPIFRKFTQLILKKFIQSIGPGPLIAAAFIGPGTVTVCTLAGANFGFSLIWAMALSIIATVILQELSGRIGIVSGSDLRKTFVQNFFDGFGAFGDRIGQCRL
jgi:manganese transport protein